MQPDACSRPAPGRRLAHAAHAAGLVAALALLPGCVSAPAVPQTQHQPTLGRVLVLAGTATPEISFEGFARSKVAGAASGAGMTFLACFGQGAGSCSGSLCGPVAVIWLGVCTVASTVGGVVGATSAPRAGKVQAAETTLRSAIDIRTIQQSLRDQVIAAAGANGTALVAAPDTPPQDYRGLAAQGVDTVLEVALNQVGTEGQGINAPVALRMQAHVRLVRTQDGAELLAADYLYRGERLQLAEWSAEQGARLERGLQLGFETLGRQIHDNLFLLYPFPDREVHAAGMLAPSFGLAPLAPRTRGALTGDRIIGSHFEWTTVANLRPLLRWQSFPRPSDQAQAPEAMGRVRKVRYDLVIAEEQNLAPGPIVYRREGLASPSHQIEQPLKPDTRYFWTVRARFELDGRQRVTEWAAMHFMARELWSAPSSWSYRFKTP